MADEHTFPRITARIDYDGDWDGQWCETGREPPEIHAYHFAEYVRADIADELLEALEQIVAKHEAVIWGEDWEYGQVAEFVERTARAAIAKARGQRDG